MAFDAGNSATAPEVDHCRSPLWNTVAAFPGKGYAIVDGARFVDLPALFSSKRLFARSLFLDQADSEIQKSGPWLISLDQAPDATEKIFALTNGAMVCWCCNDGDTVLYRHLRTINLVRIPEWTAGGASEPPPSSSTPAEAYTPVFFRHWDPSVLGALLPCLDAAQFARFLGPAQEIAFVAEGFGGLKRVLFEKAWPPPVAGMLTVRGDQCLALIARRSAGSRIRIAMYLREYAPDQTRETSNAELASAIERYEAQASHFGVRDEDEIGLWSYMQVTSRVDLSKDRSVATFMADPSRGATPGQRLKSMFDLRSRLLDDVASPSAKAL